MATRTIISGNTPHPYGATFLNQSSTNFNAVKLKTIATKHFPNGVTLPPLGGIKSVYMGSAVTITTITESGSSDFCLITKSSHGLSVGSLLMVYGTNVTGYNTVHKVTSVPDANTVKTNVPFSANTSTHGSYKVLSGDIAKMTAGRYIAPFMTNYVAGSTTYANAIRIPQRLTRPKSYAVARGDYRYHITAWNHLTNAPTKGGSAGSLNDYHDIAGNTTIGFEPYPTRAIPGEFIIGIGARPALQKDYPARTNG